MRLGQIGRRLRLFAAIEGGVIGAAIATVAAAVGVAIARGRGGAPAGDLLGALILLGAAAGAATRGARRIPLVRCARIADAALDGQDRLLSALDLDSAEPSTFARALIADAVRRAEILVPGAAVPARRPKGLPALGIAALALAAAALIPNSSRAARVVPHAPSPERHAPLPAGSLDAEREVARAAAAAGVRLGNARLAALAADFDRTLRHLGGGTLGDGAALELLRDLEAHAAEAARAAKRDGEAAEAAEHALEASPETRAAGKALAQSGAGGDDERTRAAFGASAANHPKEMARALAAAAENMAGAAGQNDDGEASEANDQPRRLTRQGNDQGAGAASEKSARSANDDEGRHLEQLGRDLDRAASACRDGDPSCRTRAEERGRDLAQAGRQGAARDSLQRLQRSAEQLRARVGRGELHDGDTHAMRSFGRAASGKGDAPGARAGGDDAPANAGGEPGSATPGGAGQESGDGSGEAQGSSGEGDGAHRGTARADDAAASAALAADGTGAFPDETAGAGNGIGHQLGGAPLGARRSDLANARGTEADVQLADSAGPGRAEVIGDAAGRGFASRGYAQMFTDYAAAVEDALGATAVPEGKRYLVRRYFDLIRPRLPARPTERTTERTTERPTERPTERTTTAPRSVP